jgi:alkylation response protein AidB-like acyl-CoA dehydrogenase
MSDDTPRRLHFLRRERLTLEGFLPGLDEALAALPLADLERPGNPGLALYREAGGAELLIPTDYGGSGADPLQAVEVHRAIGSRSPSLAVAATMHNFSVATLVEYCFYGDYTVELLRGVAADRMLVASGFAEGRTGASILDPLMTAQPVDGGYLVNGAKRPCSLSHSMHLLTASVAVPVNGGGYRRAVAVIPGDSPGIDRRPFWSSLVLGGAESEQLVLTDVRIGTDQLFFPEVDSGLDPVEAGGFLWFELLVSASYLGAASGLAERVIAGGKGDPVERVQLAIDLEGAMAALEGVARAMAGGDRGEAILVRALLVRYAVQQAVERAAARAAELGGGMAFIGSTDVGYLLAASRALAFHPPARLAVAPAIDAYLAGGPMQVA